MPTGFVGIVLGSLIALNPAESAVISNYLQDYDASQYRLTCQVCLKQQDVIDQLYTDARTYFMERRYREAIATYQQLLALQKEANNVLGVAIAQYSIGLTHSQLNQHSEALLLYQDALTTIQTLKDQNSPDIQNYQAPILDGIGTAYSSLGQYQSAIDAFQQALTAFEQIGNQPGQGNVLNNLGLTYYRLGQFSTAIDRFSQALPLLQVDAQFPEEERHYQLSEAAVKHNIGNVYRALGQYTQALESLQDAMVMFERLGDRHAQARVLLDTGFAYAEQERYEQAVERFNQSLIISREVGDRYHEGRVLNNLGWAYAKLEQHAEALPILEQALVTTRETGDRHFEGEALDSLGDAYRGLERTSEALASYQDSLVIKQAIGDRPGAVTTLSNIGALLASEQQPELAIAFYKQSVNITEAIRQELRVLPIDQQQSYTDTVADTYRALADLLLQQDRVLEAQRVLDLLKVQELDEYLRGVERSAETESGVALREAEREILELFEANQDNLLALGQELRDLEAIARTERTPEQAERIQELRRLEGVARQKFQEFIQLEDVQALVSQLRQTTEAANLELSELNALRNNLAALQQNAVVLYPLVLGDRLELVLVSANAPPIHRTTPVNREELNRTITEFRSALRTPSRNAIAPAQQLYDWLIRPIESDLAQANVETLIYAPDGQLRYIPLAALHDGDQWLIERFQINNITAASLADLDNAPAQGLSILAAAFVEGQYDVPISDRTLSFNGLTYAGQEVDNLEQLIPQTEKRLDAAFNPDIIYEMDDFSVVHLATHASFNPGPPEDSFILFGDGSRKTLTDIQNWNFQNVDLMVLSACETAVGDVPLGDGREILGFGYLMQRAGADAAIASLWQVNDGGTQALMTAFYRALQQSNITKAEALRQAQIALITGDGAALDDASRGLVAWEDTVEDTLPHDVVNRLSHPYYWAPFILIGNGL